MARAYPRPRRRLIRLLDVFTLLWLAVWILLALVVAREVRGLRALSDTVVVAGVAIRDTGELVGALEDVPFVGERVNEVAGRVADAGTSAISSGRSSRESTENLSVLLGLSIGLIPTLPLLALYAPFRIAWARETRSIKRALARDASDAALEEFLARRAVQNLGYDDLRKVSENPWRDLENGRFSALADRELERVGIRRPRERPR